MTVLQHYQLSLLLTAIVAVGVGLGLFIGKRQSKVTQWLCLYLLLVGWWCWCQSRIGAVQQPELALAWGRAMFAVVIAFPVLLTHFLSAFLERDQRNVCRIGWLLVACFFPAIFTNHFLRAGSSVGFLPTFPHAGPLFLPFNLVWLAWICYDFFWLLAQGARGKSQPTRQQVNILLVAFVSGYLAGCVNYFYFYGIYFSVLQPFATYWTPIAILLIVYGVLAYQLFDIRVVIRRSVAYSILITSLTIGYFGLVYAVEWLFRTTFGYHSVWLSLAAFALMALVFQPLKVGIQRIVDQFFFRAPHEELARRMERLEQEVRQVDKLKAISMLAAGMAHEIKNPLTSLKTFATYLPEKGNDPAFQQKFQQVVTQEVDKIDHIVRRLLEFAKPAPPQLEPAAVSQLLNETLEFLSSEALRRRIEITRTYDDTDTIQADPQQLQQVFLNLFLNSLEAMNGSGGTLSVATARHGSNITVTIRDTGKGISKEHLHHVFDPFFTTKSHGTGLGLSIVQSIVTEHRGTIAFESQPNRGTTCTLTFPLR
jgi:signal transduction histidine kinase